MRLTTGDDQATAALHREWLRSLPARTGKSLTRLADDLGMARSTLTRPLKKDDPGTSTLHAATIDKIVLATGVSPPGTAAQPTPTAVRSLRGFAEDAVPFTPDHQDGVTAAVRALIAGRNGIDPWRLKTRALELAGFMPGDVVLVDLNATPQPGDAVCAQVYDWQTMRADTIMRVFERAAPVNLLVSRSMDPALQQPIVVDGERVVVKGVILRHRFGMAA